MLFLVVEIGWGRLGWGEEEEEMGKMCGGSLSS